jgi:pSer/pThr/pTyr-binding forkhead associated (FHA) protein
MPAQLVAIDEDSATILVDKPILLLGRHPECDIQIESRKISRRHCCIAQVNDYLVVRDLDSTNGIRINGVRVVEGKLVVGDELTIGNHRYQLVWEEHPSSHRAKPGKGPVPTPKNKAVVTPTDRDEALESSDEPIALPDPKGKARRPAPPPPRPKELAGTEQEDSFAIPEEYQVKKKKPS